MPKSKETEKVKDNRNRRAIQEMEFDLWKEPDAKATFTFKLRPRLIQVGNPVKLLCCLSGKPSPKVYWFKSGNPISEIDPHYNLEYSCGVCTLEIKSCYLSDAGNFKCRAENALGFDETLCSVNVEGTVFNKKKLITQLKVFFIQK